MSVYNFIKKYFNLYHCLFRWLFVSRCLSCNVAQADSNMCNHCFAKLTFLPKSCKRCQQPFDFLIPGVDVCDQCETVFKNIDQSLCLFIYDKNIRNLILKFKNFSDFAIGKWFAKLIYYRGRNILQDAVLIPVPLDVNRLIYRGYNQSYILSEQICSVARSESGCGGCASDFGTDSGGCSDLGACYVVDALKRVRYTQSQAQKSVEARFENVEQAFEVDQKYISLINGKKVVIIDDVVTTGATVSECAKVLALHASKVFVIAVARQLYKAKRRGSVPDDAKDLYEE